MSTMTKNCNALNKKNSEKMQNQTNSNQKLSNSKTFCMSNSIYFTGRYSPHDANIKKIPLKDQKLIKADNAIKKLREIENQNKGNNSRIVSQVDSFLSSLALSICETNPKTNKPELIMGNTPKDIIRILETAMEIRKKASTENTAGVKLGNFVASMGEMLYENPELFARFSRLAQDNPTMLGRNNLLKKRALIMDSKPTLQKDAPNYSDVIMDIMSFESLFEYIEQAEFSPKELLELLECSYWTYDRDDRITGTRFYMYDKFSNPSISKNYREEDMPKYREKLFVLLDRAIKEYAIPQHGEYLKYEQELEEFYEANRKASERGEEEKRAKHPEIVNPVFPSIVALIKIYGEFIPESKKEEYRQLAEKYMKYMKESDIRKLETFSNGKIKTMNLK